MKLVIISGQSRADELLSGCGIVRAERLGMVDCAEAAVILGRGADVFPEAIRAALCVIVNGDEKVRELPRGINLVSCGASHKNTVSFTSRQEDAMTLSLNRSIRCLDGFAEPFEAPCAIPDGFSGYDIMSVFAARVLLGLKNSAEKLPQTQSVLSFPME